MFFSTFSAVFVILWYLDDSHSYRVIRNSLWLLFAFSWWLVILSILSCICWPFAFLPLKNAYWHASHILKYFFVVEFHPLLIFWLLILYQMWHLHIFSQFCQFPLDFVEHFLCCTEASSFDVICCSINQEVVFHAGVLQSFPMFVSSNLMDSGFRFRSLIHYELNFGYDIRMGSWFILLYAETQFSQLI